MPVVLADGVPDAARVWSAAVSRLTRADVVTPSLPGFAVPVPRGFQIEAIDPRAVPHGGASGCRMEGLSDRLERRADAAEFEGLRA